MSVAHNWAVLLDAVMPDMDGFECCAQLQQELGDRHTPILMITGLDDQDSGDRAFQVGATDYVTKPVHWAVLRQRVRRLIQQAQLQRQLQAANQELQRLASVDSLTQVANHRWFEAPYLECGGRQSRSLQPVQGGNSRHSRRQSPVSGQGNRPRSLLLRLSSCEIKTSQSAPIPGKPLASSGLALMKNQMKAGENAYTEI